MTRLAGQFGAEFGPVRSKHETPQVTESVPTQPDSNHRDLGLLAEGHVQISNEALRTFLAIFGVNPGPNPNDIERARRLEAEIYKAVQEGIESGRYTREKGLELYREATSDSSGEKLIALLNGQTKPELTTGRGRYDNTGEQPSSSDESKGTDLLPQPRRVPVPRATQQDDENKSLLQRLRPRRPGRKGVIAVGVLASVIGITGFSGLFSNDSDATAEKQSIDTLPEDLQTLVNEYSFGQAVLALDSVVLQRVDEQDKLIFDESGNPVTDEFPVNEEQNLDLITAVTVNHTFEAEGQPEGSSVPIEAFNYGVGFSNFEVFCTAASSEDATPIISLTPKKPQIGPYNKGQYTAEVDLSGINCELSEVFFYDSGKFEFNGSKEDILAEIKKHDTNATMETLDQLQKDLNDNVDSLRSPIAGNAMVYLSGRIAENVAKELKDPANQVIFSEPLSAAIANAGYRVDESNVTYTFEPELPTIVADGLFASVTSDNLLNPNNTNGRIEPLTADSIRRPPNLIEVNWVGPATIRQSTNNNEVEKEQQE